MIQNKHFSHDISMIKKTPPLLVDIAVEAMALL